MQLFAGNGPVSFWMQYVNKHNYIDWCPKRVQIANQLLKMYPKCHQGQFSNKLSYWKEKKHGFTSSVYGKKYGKLSTIEDHKYGSSLHILLMWLYSRTNAWCRRALLQVAMTEMFYKWNLNHKHCMWHAGLRHVDVTRDNAISHTSKHFFG